MTLTFPDSMFPDTQRLIPNMGGMGQMPAYSVAMPTILFPKSERWQLQAQWDFLHDINVTDDTLRDDSERRELTQFFTRVRVGRDSFFMPQHTAPQRGTFNGTPVIGVESADGTEIPIGGGGASEDDWFLAGDFISVNCQLLMVLNDVNTDAGGIGSMEVWPPLRVAPDSGTTVITSGAFGVFDLTADPTFSIYKPGYTGSVIIEAMEHISSADLL